MEKYMENMELSLVISDETKEVGKLAYKSNVANLIASINNIADEVKALDIANTDLETVKLYKKQFTSLRTGIQKGVQEYKDMYVNPCLQALKVDTEKVLSAIADGENVINTRLDEIEQRRVKALTIVLDSYVTELADEFNLTEEDKNRVEYKKAYFNKTADENATYEDLRAQCVVIKEQKEQRETDIQLIKTLCERNGVSPAPYVDMLDFLSCSVICNKITALKTETRTVVNEEVKKGQTENKKTVTVTLTYRESFGKELTRFLIDNGVDFSFVK